MTGAEFVLQENLTKIRSELLGMLDADEKVFFDPTETTAEELNVNQNRKDEKQDEDETEFSLGDEEVSEPLDVVRLAREVDECKMSERSRLCRGVLRNSRANCLEQSKLQMRSEHLARPLYSSLFKSIA